jgi:hypothetical protein
MNYLNPSIPASEQICARMPTPRAEPIHQIHAAGGVGGCITNNHGGGVYCVFVLCVVVSSCCLYLPYVKKYERITLR